jgi:hypothetical protein
MCDILDDSRLQDTTLQLSSWILASANVRSKIPALFSSVLECCARLIENIGRKRETINFLIPWRIRKPFATIYALPLAALRSHRDSFISAVQNEASQRSISTPACANAEARPGSYRPVQTVAQLPSCQHLDNTERRMRALISSLPDSLDIERERATDALLGIINSPSGTRMQNNETLGGCRISYGCTHQLLISRQSALFPRV